MSSSVARTTQSVVVAFLLAASWISASCSGDDDPAPTDVGPVLLGDAGDVAGGDTSDAASTPDSTVACTVNADCRGGELCRQGQCLRACSEDLRCDDPTQVCDVTLGVCVGCVSSDDCGAGGECVDRQCVGGCSSDADCRGGEFCNDENQCVVAECIDDGDCLGGFRCVSRECVSILDQVCEPGTTECDGATLLTCNRDGTAQDATECDDGCAEADGVAACLDQICEPDAITCVDSFTAGLCNAQGTALEELPCREDQFCAAGQCLAQVCTPDESVCAGDTISSCNASGSAAVITPCAEVDGCDTALGCGCVEAECVPRICTPSSSRCVGNASQACNDSGTAYESPVTCDAGQSCTAGQCVDPSCTPGTTTCSGDTLLTCASDGRTRSSTDCTATSDICVVEGGVAQCDDRLCTPGVTSCAANGTTRLICDARGATQTAAPCGADLFCQAGACVELDCDPRTCAQLDGAGIARPDSDSDGIADCVEGISIGPGGLPACADPDQDGDGVRDGDEAPCASIDTIRTADSDGDGFDDGLERLVGTDRCSSLSAPDDLADLVVGRHGDTDSATFDLNMTATAGRTDIALLLDTTGSMGTTISALRTSFESALVGRLAPEFPNLAWGLATYADFPCTGTGSSSDRPYVLRQRVTTDPALVTTALNTLSAAGGFDTPESTYEALYQLATGVGVSGCGMTVPAFDPALNRVPGVADGPFPGLGFRNNADALIVHYTDAVAQEATAYPGVDAATFEDAIEAVTVDRNARYIGISTTTSTTTAANLRDIADATASVIPTCGWQADLPFDCAAGQCCTGNNGTGLTAPTDRLCTAVAIDSDPSGVSATSLAAYTVGAMLRSTPIDGVRPARQYVDGAADNILRIVATSQISAAQADADCGAPETVAASGIWNNVYPGARLTVRVNIQPAELAEDSWVIVDVNAVTPNGSVIGAVRVLVARY